MVAFSDPPTEASYGPGRSMCTCFPRNFAREYVHFDTPALIPFAIEHPADELSHKADTMLSCRCPQTRFIGMGVSDVKYVDV